MLGKRLILSPRNRYIAGNTKWAARPRKIWSSTSYLKTRGKAEIAPFLRKSEKQIL